MVQRIWSATNARIHCAATTTTTIMSESEQPRFRLVVLGAAKVGKSAIIRRFLHNDFSTKYRETVEDMHSKECVVKGIPVTVDILDTNINFPDMRRVAIASANAFIIVFAVDNVQSFKEMSDLWGEIAERRADFRQVPAVFVGNKSDAAAKKIYEATANAWTSRLNAKVRYVETSAQTGDNISGIFGSLLELSGFPDGFDLPEPKTPKTPPSRVGSQKDKLRKIKENSILQNEKVSPQNDENELCDQISSGLTLPFDRLNVLRRNHSMRINRSKNLVESRPPAAQDDHQLISKGSIIRRTKHLSLKLHKTDDKRIVAPANDENQKEQPADCIIS